jgi:hypothetical protein
MPSQTDVVSFVLRFVQETTNSPAASAKANWYGLIRHVQTDNEERFTCLADLITFISRYVDLADLALISSAAGSGTAEMTDTLATE